MQIKNEPPPNIAELKKHFPVDEFKAIFTYADCIYNPHGIFIADELMAHEEVHARQQRHCEEGAEVWWDKVIKHRSFQIDQEAEAYAAQHAYYCSRYKDKNMRYQHLFKMASALSSALYGSALKHSEAMDKIKAYGQK